MHRGRAGDLVLPSAQEVCFLTLGPKGPPLPGWTPPFTPISRPPPLLHRNQDCYGGGGPKVVNVSAGSMPSRIFHVIMLLPGWGGGVQATPPSPEYATEWVCVYRSMFVCVFVCCSLSVGDICMYVVCVGGGGVSVCCLSVGDTCGHMSVGCLCVLQSLCLGT